MAREHNLSAASTLEVADDTHADVHAAEPVIVAPRSRPARSRATAGQGASQVAGGGHAVAEDGRYRRGESDSGGGGEPELVVAVLDRG